MSLSILQELDHPTHPRSQAEAAIVKVAQYAYGSERSNASASYMDGLKAELDMSGFDWDFYDLEPNPDGLVGRAIGRRAGMLGLSVETPDSPGFQVMSGREIDALRDAKSLGTLLARKSDLNFLDTLKTSVEQIQAGRIGLEEPLAISGIGLVIGVRHFELSPPEGIPEREAA